MLDEYIDVVDGPLYLVYQATTDGIQTHSFMSRDQARSFVRDMIASAR